jgi:2-phosphoglycerate kinase
VEVRLQVGNFHPIAWNTQAFDSLALEEDKKRMIQALVSAQKTDVQNDMDIVKGKGKGLIILLHGPPGVGKTVTAEWYVVYALMALLSILTWISVSLKRCKSPCFA